MDWVKKRIQRQRADLERKRKLLAQLPDVLTKIHGAVSESVALYIAEARSRYPSVTGISNSAFQIRENQSDHETRDQTMQVIEVSWDGVNGHIDVKGPKNERARFEALLNENGQAFLSRNGEALSAEQVSEVILVPLLFPEQR